MGPVGCDHPGQALATCRLPGMMTFPDLRMRELQDRAARARTHYDEGRFVDAREGFLAARQLARRLGVDSAYLATSLALSTEQCGDLETAFAIAGEAISLDPASPSTIQAFSGLSWQLRGRLVDPDRSADDPSTPRIYALLLGAGEADVGCHVAMARHHASAGRLGEAGAILDAVLKLAPVCRDAWLARAELARATRDDMEAAACEARAKGLSTTQVPFGLPSGRGLPC